jgi:hypothetical protein
MAKKKVGRTTKRIREEQSKEESLYDQLQSELHFMAFHAIKQIVQEELRQTSGTMPCILCGKDLAFFLTISNNHLHVQCTREGCIKAME